MLSAIQFWGRPFFKKFIVSQVATWIHEKLMVNYGTPEFLPSVWKNQLMLTFKCPSGSCSKFYNNVPETKLQCLQLSVLKSTDRCTEYRCSSWLCTPVCSFWVNPHSHETLCALNRVGGTSGIRHISPWKWIIFVLYSAALEKKGVPSSLGSYRCSEP